MDRTDALQRFLEAARISFEKFATVERSLASIRTIFSEVSVSKDMTFPVGSRRPFCETILDDLLRKDYRDPQLNDLVACFADVENHVRWAPRPVSNPTASRNFPDNHANGMVIGPGGIIQHPSIMIGASLLAPNVRYPDHDHAPEETYLVLTDGEFRQEEGRWFSPGCGGSFYNTRGIKHAMRSGSEPLFAFWVLHA